MGLESGSGQVESDRALAKWKVSLMATQVLSK